MEKHKPHTSEIDCIEDATLSTSHKPSSMPSSYSQQAKAVLVVEQKRRRFTKEQKLAIVRESYLPGHSVSSVSREYGLQPSLLFKRRAPESQRALNAMAGEPAVSIKEVIELRK